ncbi:hypothetical protein EI94DRAFT_1749906 [Lactarius quietus]|nr:hypothetical protein EI94DRAFT_1749906 [Lactarius quietus]
MSSRPPVENPPLGESDSQDADAIDYGALGDLLAQYLSHFQNESNPAPAGHYCCICPELKAFGRQQELNRHLRQVHQPPRGCPFESCNYEWKRPDRIKAHIINVHGSLLCPVITKAVRGLYGKNILNFVDNYEADPRPYLEKRVL